MLKHLPEGLVPFEDCGFARHPFAPLAMEPVRVDCRVDAEDGQPVLRLRVDGGRKAKSRPKAQMAGTIILGWAALHRDRRSATAS